MTSAPLDTFLTGVMVALAVAMPIGPMAVFCIQQTLSSGLAAGIVIGVAAASVQAAYGVVAVLGLGRPMMTMVATRIDLFSVASAALLLWFALRIARSEVVVAGGAPLFFWRSCREALVLGFTNPLTPLLFFAAFPAITSESDIARAPILISGVFFGAIAWYLLLGSMVALARGRLSPRALNGTNKVSGLALGTLGLLMATNALGMR